MDSLLREGSRGPEVLALQGMLNRATTPAAPIKEDGIFGPKTKTSVTAFQTRYSLSCDGIAGPITQAVLAANHYFVDHDAKQGEARNGWCSVTTRT